MRLTHILKFIIIRCFQPIVFQIPTPGASKQVLLRYDKHYLAKFSVTKFPAAWVALWMAPSSLATKKWFRIEPEEAFIPKDLSLLPNTSKMTTPEILIYEYGKLKAAIYCQVVRDLEF